MQRLPAADASEVCITFEGRPLVAREGDSVAAALLAAGVEVFRHTPAGGRAQAPIMQ